MSRLRDTVSQYWLNIQGSLFPWLTEELGSLTKKQQELVTTLEKLRIEEFLINCNIVSINDIATHSVASSEQIAQANHDLARMATGLQTMVGHFIVVA